MSSASKNSSSVPSQTEPPRGTMASPNTVMTMEPVRDGSRFNSSTMRASGGCGMPQRIPRFSFIEKSGLALEGDRDAFLKSLSDSFDGTFPALEIRALRPELKQFGRLRENSCHHAFGLSRESSRHSRMY